MKNLKNMKNIPNPKRKLPILTLLHTQQIIFTRKSKIIKIIVKEIKIKIQRVKRGLKS
jgi:hypothetical protein